MFLHEITCSISTEVKYFKLWGHWGFCSFVTFRVQEISRGAHRLTRTSAYIEKERLANCRSLEKGTNKPVPQKPNEKKPVEKPNTFFFFFDKYMMVTTGLPPHLQQTEHLLGFSRILLNVWHSSSGRSLNIRISYDVNLILVFEYWN